MNLETIRKAGFRAICPLLMRINRDWMALCIVASSFSPG